MRVRLPTAEISLLTLVLAPSFILYQENYLNLLNSVETTSSSVSKICDRAIDQLRVT